MEFIAYVNLLAVRYRVRLAQRSVVGSSAHLCVHRSVCGQFVPWSESARLFACEGYFKLVPIRF